MSSTHCLLSTENWSIPDELYISEFLTSHTFQRKCTVLLNISFTSFLFSFVIVSEIAEIHSDITSAVVALKNRDNSCCPLLETTSKPSDLHRKLGKVNFKDHLITLHVDNLVVQNWDIDPHSVSFISMNFINWRNTIHFKYSHCEHYIS